VPWAVMAFGCDNLEEEVRLPQGGPGGNLMVRDFGRTIVPPQATARVACPIRSPPGVGAVQPGRGNGHEAPSNHVPST